LSDGSTSVIKLFEKDFSSGDSSFRFDRECKGLAQLKHKNIVSLIKWGVTDNISWIIFPYERSLTLEDYVKNHRALPPETLLKIFVQICRGIEHAHEQGIIHRDLKSENILVKEDGTPLIIDFGLAKSELMNTVQTATGLIVGTPQFMAPELLFGKAKASNFTDLYSLGIILYEMFTRTTPFSASNLSETIMKMGSGEFQTVRQISNSISLPLSEFISKVIVVDVNKRKFKSVKSLRIAVEDILRNKRQFFNKSSVPTKKSRVAKSGNGSENATQNMRLRSSVVKSGRGSKNATQKSRVSYLLGFVVLFFFVSVVIGFSWFSGDSGSDEKMKLSLANSKSYADLGAIVIKEGEYAKFPGGGAFLSLAGRLEAIKLIVKTDPDSAFDIYLETLELPAFARTSCETSFLKMIQSLLPSMAEDKVSLFYLKLSTISWFKSKGHQKSVIDSYKIQLNALSLQQRSLYKLRAFLILCSHNDFSSSIYDEVLDEAQLLLSEIEAKHPHLAIIDYFHLAKDSNSRSRIASSYSYLKSVGTDLLYSDLDKNIKKGDVKEKICAYSTKLPLSIAILAFYHLQLVEERLERLSLVDREEQDIGWFFLEHWLGLEKNSSGEKYGKPFVPFYLFEGNLKKLLKLAISGDRSRLMSSISRFWLYAHSHDEPGVHRFIWFRRIAYALKEVEQNPWIVDGNYNYDNKKMYIEEAVKEIQNDVTHTTEDMLTWAIKDEPYYLSFLFHQLVAIKDFKRASVIYANLLKCDTLSSNDFSFLIPHIYLLLSDERNLGAVRRMELVENTIKYVKSSLGHPQIQGQTSLMLLSVFVDIKENEKSICEEEQLQIGSKLRKTSVVSSFKFLKKLSPLQLGKAALLFRLNHQSHHKIERIEGSISFSPLLSLVKAEAIVYTWFVHSVARVLRGEPGYKSSGGAARLFIKHELPSLKDWVFGICPDKCHLWYVSMLSEGLRWSGRNSSIDDMAGGQEELAFIISQYLKANISEIDKDELLHVSGYIGFAYAEQSYEPVLALVAELLDLIESNCSSCSPKKLNFARFTLAGILSKYVFLTSGVPLKERIITQAASDSRKQSVELCNRSFQTIESIFYGSDENLPIKRWKMARKLLAICFFLSKYEEALKVFEFFTIDKAPFILQAKLLQCNIKASFGVISSLETDKKNKQENTKKINELRKNIKVLLSDYENLPRFSPVIGKTVSLALSDKVFRTVGLAIDF